jgi:L-2-hydroxyglutarate oxidase LhgO
VDSKLSSLEDLKKGDDANGVENLKLLNETEVWRIEPRVRCFAGLHSPETGILDMAAYIRTMEKVLKELRVTIVKQCKVDAIMPHYHGKG